MKKTKIMILMAALALAWGCSSGSDSGDSDNNGNGDGNLWNGSTYAVSDRPAWAVDWSANVARPEWSSPDSRYESSMHMLIRLDDELTRHSTDNDQMAVFIDGECRGASPRNVLSDGRVVFLLRVEGSGSDAGKQVELRYYCDQLHHLNTIGNIAAFSPGNILSAPYTHTLNVGDGSVKYPVATQLTLVMPQSLPFSAGSTDLLAVFVGDECRGVGTRTANGNWQLTAYGIQAGETAQIRYYSAEMQGIYTILKTVSLSGKQQQETISF